MRFVALQNLINTNHHNLLIVKELFTNNTLILLHQVQWLINRDFIPHNLIWDLVEIGDIVLVNVELVPVIRSHVALHLGGEEKSLLPVEYQVHEVAEQEVDLFILVHLEVQDHALDVQALHTDGLDVLFINDNLI